MTIYSERLVAIDLDKFKKYLDVYGVMAGDAVLREIGQALRAHYGFNSVYRTGGDEFVVVLGVNEVWMPPSPKDVMLTHAVVDVAIPRDPHQTGQLVSWIQLHLAAGYFKATPEGARIACGTPIWLTP